MTFNILYGSLQKAGNSSRILFHSSASTTSITEGLSKRRNEIFQTNGICKCQAAIRQRPHSAFTCKEMHIHTSVSKHFCSKEKEKNDSDINGLNNFQKNEQGSKIQNDKMKGDKSRLNLYKKRSFYKIRHQNLVWDGPYKQNRQKVYKTSIADEKSKEIPKKTHNCTHSLVCKNSDNKVNRESQNTELTKDSFAKNILTIDIFSDSESSPISRSPQFKTITEDNIIGNSNIGSKAIPTIENSDKIIFLKEIVGNSQNKWKVGNENSLIKKSKIIDGKQIYLTALNANKKPVNEIVIKKKYEPYGEIKNIMDDDNSFSLHKDHSINVSDKKSNDNKDLNPMKKSLINKNSEELMKDENLKSFYSNDSKSSMNENNNISTIKNTRDVEGRGTVWNAIHKQRKSPMITNNLQYQIYLKNKIQNSYKHIDLYKRYKFANFINSILRPVKTKLPASSLTHNTQVLPKYSNPLTAPSQNTGLNIARERKHPFQCLLEEALYLKSMNIEIPGLSELLKNPKDCNSLINFSRVKSQNKIQLIKDINYVSSNRKIMVNDLKNDIRSWKKCEHLRKVILDSTSEIYQSISNGRKLGKIIRNCLNIPRRKRKKKCKVISIPLSPRVDISKHNKITLTQIKRNMLNDTNNTSSKPDPIMALHIKYKKNYYTTFNDLLKKNETLIFREKFRNHQVVLEYNPRSEFQTEKKSGLMDKYNKEILMKNTQQISQENKRYLHQINDEIKNGSSKVNEVNTYPSGCLKKPELIIELQQLEDGRHHIDGTYYEEMKRLTHQNDSQTNNVILNTTERNSPTTDNALNKETEKAENKISLDPSAKFNKSDIECKDTKLNTGKHRNGNGKPISFSALCKIKSVAPNENQNFVSENKSTMSEKKPLNPKMHSALHNSHLDQEHYLTYESIEEIEPTLNKHSQKGKGIQVVEVDPKEPYKLKNSEKGQTKINDSDNNGLNDNKTYKLKNDQLQTNNIEVEVCSNSIYDQEKQKASISQEVIKKSDNVAIDKKLPKFIEKPQENRPSKNGSPEQNQSEFLPTDFTETKDKSMMSSSPPPLHPFEISLNSPQLPKKLASVSKEAMESKKTQIGSLTGGFFPKAEAKKEMVSSSIRGIQDIKPFKNPISTLNQIFNTCCRNEKLSRDMKCPNSNSGQYLSNITNHLENKNSAFSKQLGEEALDNSCKEISEKQVNTYFSTLPIKLNNIKKENVTSELKSSHGDLENCANKESRKYQNLKENENFHNFLVPFKQLNIFKAENAGVNEFKFINFLKNCYPELSYFNKKALIDNIREFFRISYNYFKLGNANLLSDEKDSRDSIMSNSCQSKEKIFKNLNINNPFSPTSLSPKQKRFIPKSDLHINISDECCKPSLYQKKISYNNGENKLKLLPSSFSKQGNEDTSLSENEEFRIKFSKMLPISSIGNLHKHSRESEHLIPNEEIYLNDLETAGNMKNMFCKPTISQFENSLIQNNFYNNPLKKENIKDFEKFYVNQVKQHRSLHNLKHKIPFLKLGLKNRFNNKKQRIPKENLIYIQNKLKGFHNSMTLIDGSTNLLKSRGNRMSEIPFEGKPDLKPILKNNPKHKKGTSFKPYSDVKIKLRAKEKLNLLKDLSSHQKSSETSNPESYWLDCFSKNIFTDDKISPNEFLTYIKKRKLTIKSSLKSNT